MFSLWPIGKCIECGGMEIANEITVDQNGQGEFTTVQAAIDSVQTNNDQWVKIHINAGTYVEKVEIPKDKPCVILEGDKSISTFITYGDHDATDESATFASSASNVVVSGITFENTFDLEEYLKIHNITEKQQNEIKPAVAAKIGGDKSYFLSCTFRGCQDTLFDQLGRHYFKHCAIEGQIDFIFGYARSFYENCWINTTKGKNAGFVTANGRNASTDEAGFVFFRGSVVGAGEVNLGRAWGSYSTTIFHRTYLGSLVTPQGWDSWYYKGNENSLTYAEVSCSGPGANNPNRVSWMKKLNGADVQTYDRSSFINQDGWLDNLPNIYQPV
ncbi:hypothetical protein TanjilG_29666 [Lupinus angustifolius]|uniref:pectinesterase n=1 Tax=Lupinus angustifolius TaxID=3871 RepID=A0A4P1R5U4_LUPAN|nr:PREDICTED: probable pectinesterase 66 [Lupinus angustifolius]OIW02890.1 hypothetical protein TanjilG_29666 [Lupinus angustifolius]